MSDRNEAYPERLDYAVSTDDKVIAFYEERELSEDKRAIFSLKQNLENILEQLSEAEQEAMALDTQNDVLKGSFYGMVLVSVIELFTILSLVM